MADERVILVTGVANHWGSRAAAKLLAQDNVHVIGIDNEPPHPAINGLDFIQADTRNSLLVELLQAEAVDTVLHLQFRETLSPGEASFDQNVMGTAKLLGACSEAGIKQIVIPSSTMVYGARPDNPMFLREDHPLNGPKKYGYIRDWIEMENYAENFREQNPDTILTVLRFGNIVGKGIDSPMTRFLREEQAVTLLGFDPMVQLIHGDDVVSALVHAVNGSYSGVYNIATEKGLPLWKTLGLSGKIPLPVLHPLAYWSVSLGGPRLAPMPLDYLRYPCMGDMQKMRDELGFTPMFTPEESVRELASTQRLRKLLHKKNSQALQEDHLRDTIQRRKRARSHNA